MSEEKLSKIEELLNESAKVDSWKSGWYNGNVVRISLGSETTTVITEDLLDEREAREFATLVLDEKYPLPEGGVNEFVAGLVGLWFRGYRPNRWHTRASIVMRRPYNNGDGFVEYSEFICAPRWAGMVVDNSEEFVRELREGYRQFAAIVGAKCLDALPKRR